MKIAYKQRLDGNFKKPSQINTAFKHEPDGNFLCFHFSGRTVAVFFYVAHMLHSKPLEQTALSL